MIEKKGIMNIRRDGTGDIFAYGDTFVYVEAVDIFNLKDVGKIVNLFHEAFKVIEKTGFFVIAIEMPLELMAFLIENASEHIQKGYFWTAEMIISSIPSRVAFHQEGKDSTLVEANSVISTTQKVSAKIPPEIIEKAEERKAARLNNDWGLADEIRDEITKADFVIEDTLDSYRLRYVGQHKYDLPIYIGSKRIN